MSGVELTTTPVPPRGLWSGWAGPKNPKILLVGEAWGADEDQMKKPFAGTAGKELWLMLGEALGSTPAHSAAAERFRYGGLAWLGNREDWLAERGLAFTNVLNFRPPANDLRHVSVDKKTLGKEYTLPAMGRGNYLDPQFLGELVRLFREIELAKPNLVVALGATAAWALLGATNIGSIRGTIVMSEGLDRLAARAAASAGAAGPTLSARSVKVLSTYHPAGVLRQWDWRPIVVADLIKAGREGETADFVRPARSVLVDPTLAQVQAWTAQTLAAPPARLACDVETAFRTITVFGIARSRDDALVVPFYDPRKPDGNYWSTHAEEKAAWACVEALLDSDIPMVGQNFLYDLQYILPLGLRVRNQSDDLMLMHHSIFPEMKKGLGFLGSIYTREPAWKLMRRRRPDSEKKDE